jgi:hypothetical protein
VALDGAIFMKQRFFGILCPCPGSVALVLGSCQICVPVFLLCWLGALTLLMLGKRFSFEVVQLLL